MKEKILRVFANHNMEVTDYHLIVGYPNVEVMLHGRDSFPGEMEMKQIADEIGTDTIWAECRRDSMMWVATVSRQNQSLNWADTENYEPKRIYVDRLDIDYFIKCVENSVDYVMNECKFSDSELKKELEKIRTQIYGLRDLFWVFTSDNIMRIAEPVRRVMKE